MSNGYCDGPSGRCGIARGGGSATVNMGGALMLSRLVIHTAIIIIIIWMCASELRIGFTMHTLCFPLYDLIT